MRNGRIANSGTVAALAACILLTSTGCARFKPHKSEWKDAVIDPDSKKIVTMWLVNKDNEADQEPALLHMEYGMFLVWNEYDGKHFYLFDNKAKKYFGTTDFSKFLAALDAMPRGITLEYVTTCLLSPAHGMPDEERARWEQVMKAGNHDYSCDYTVECCGNHLKFLDSTTSEK